MDITQLPGRWRRKADSQPMISSNDVDIRLTLRQCADELELAYHQHAHDTEFYSGCRFCDWEQEHNDNYPEHT
jgi:hypothetical protein